VNKIKTSQWALAGLPNLCFDAVSKFRIAEIIDFATQVWAIARVSALSPKIHFIFHLLHKDLD
jgi:hypothetical protein